MAKPPEKTQYIANQGYPEYLWPKCSHCGRVFEDREVVVPIGSLHPSYQSFICQDQKECSATKAGS